MKKFTAVAVLLVASSLAGYANSDVVLLEQEEVSKVQLVQQSALEQSSRFAGMDSASTHVMCVSVCIPTVGTPALFLAYSPVNWRLISKNRY